MGRSNTWANEKWKRREQVILFRCWLNAGRPTNDSFGTLRFASYVRRGGRDCGGPECLAAGGKRRKKKKKKKWRNALKLRRQGRSSIQHIWIYFKKFFLLFFFFLDFSFSFLSSSSLHIFSFLFFRSFVRSFVFFFVIGMSRSASFQHSFRGHQGRSFFSASSHFSIPTRRWRESQAPNSTDGVAFN